MSSHSRTERRAVAGALVVVFGALLAGCSDPGLYFDRRDSIALSAGDAIEANKVAQVIDPWPPQSGNINIAFNGQRMTSAVERYRTNVTVPPIDPMMMQVASPIPPTPQTGSSQSSTNSNTTTNAVGSSTSSTTTTTTQQ